MTREVEVCVVGGGPAGASLAGRLARLGHDVAVVERHRFPRPHVGESLSRGVWPLLDSLGVRERVAAHGFARPVEARVRWRGAEERLPVDGGLTVDRGAFDAILLDQARTAGAALLAPAAARSPVRSGDGWELPLGDRLVRARFLVDASGRRRLLGGRRTRTAPQTLALPAIWRDVPASDGAQTRVDAMADGWIWGAHLTGGGFRAIAFIDPETLRAERGDRERLYRRLMAASPTFADLTADAGLAGPVQACDATTYAASTPVDRFSIKVGEAAFAIDPLSSCGVQTAIQTGLAAAAVVHSILAPDGDADAAIEYYGDHQRHSVARHAETAARLYAEHRPHGDTVFWRRRRVDAPAPRRPPAPLASVLPMRMRLAPAAALVSRPCLVGDRIERRRCLSHPGLDRPVAFLGGSELAPLLDGLQAAPTLAEVVSCWDRRLPPGRAAEIAAWLHRRGMIETAPAG